MLDGEMPLMQADFADILSGLIIVNFDGQYSDQFTLFKLKEPLSLAGESDFKNVTFGAYQIDSWRQTNHQMCIADLHMTSMHDFSLVSNCTEFDVHTNQVTKSDLYMYDIRVS